MITLPESSPGPLEVGSAGRYLRSLAGRQRRTILAGALLGTLWTLTQAAIPLALGRTVDAGVVHSDRGRLITGCLVLVGLGAASAGTGVLRHRLAVSNWLQSALRTQQLLGQHVAQEGLAVAAAKTTGEVVETLSGDAPRIGDLYDITARATGSLITYLAVAVLLIRLDLVLGLWVAIGMPALSATLALVVRPLQSREGRHRDAEGELTALGADTVAGLRVLRGIGGEQEFLARYRESSQRVRAAGVRVAGPQSILDAAQVFLPGVFVVVLTWLGAHATLAGRLSVGDLVTVYGLAAFLRLPLETASETLTKVVRAVVGARRVVAIMACTDAEAAAAGAVAAAGAAADAVADGAGGGGRGVLFDPASGLILAAGELTALVSADPLDAIRITDRLGRLDRSAEAGLGSPLLHGMPLADLPVAQARSRVLLSEAEPRLFSGSLRAQLDPDRRHPDAAVLAAIEAADALDVLAALPEGLESAIEERGRDLSGGQRQRLALARALLADPEVLVLVEPTSSVDAHTEARIAGRLRAARAGRTTLVSTASPLLLDVCDQVIFVSAGGGVGAQGSHARLLASDPAYRQVVLREDDEPDGADHAPGEAGPDRGDRSDRSAEWQGVLR